jgi:hypothetical protein
MLSTPKKRISQLIVQKTINLDDNGSFNPLLAINTRLMNIPEIQDNVAAL